MKRIISFVVISLPLGILLQGCYTIVNLPEISYDEYVYTPDQIYHPTPLPGGLFPAPEPEPPHPPHPPVIIQPIIIEQIHNPSPPITREGDIKKIRDSGNGRGNSGRNTDFNKSTNTRTDTNSSTNNNPSTNNDNNRSSSNAGNLGNTRR